MSNNSFNSKSRGEQVAIIAHEIGHAIGLGHSQFDHNLMYYQSISTRERLGWDDIDGVTYLYPTEQPIGGCGVIEDISKNNFLMSFLIGILFFMLMFKAIQTYFIKLRGKHYV